MGEEPRKYTREEIAAAEAVRMPFGKFQGTTLGGIFDREPLYLDWLGRELLLMTKGGGRGESGHPELRAAVALLVEHHAPVIKRSREFRDRQARGKGDLFL